ncbi:type I secretion system permease/ATPase [Roseomonas alkaliterrae]|uniref:ATP-binding cassette subfamily C protein/ATP-binding cassette subfamily C protein EexD n=1 Tax=Neoroseomonas alkaliterrae TaxID=1452450 RepID=A0A840Y7D3_9PROT|nr:type I secretion system permease/ATPase [Neoroseomonas alkaliterrae]MBB5689794.1 ATP-binding cassette subfamily C protein/ATP-binding cassette subfamily C protein EexD [Neoroseomonas alkaliterrae]MBR0675630.1 type I secretion system permease/ATPase [Neoroseomonas alkaliterrae]
MATDARALPGESRPTDTPLARALAACRRQLLAVGVFSGVVNVLQLTVSIYMMQVFDRVLSTRNLNTLLYLTLIAIAALALLALLEGARSRVMQRIGGWMEEKVAPEGFARAVESQLRGRPYRMEALRDLAVCRGFIASPGALALYDVPWVPIYLLVILALHPVLGAVAAAGAALLLGLTILNEIATARLLRQANSAALASQRRAESILRNAEVIDSMGMLPAVMARWRRSVAEMTAPMNRAMDRAVPLVAGTKFLRLAVQVAILGVGAYFVLEQQLTAGASIAASIIMGRALAPVEQLIGGWKQLVQARQSWRRLQAFLVLPRLRPEGKPLPEPSGRLAVERVTFAFPGTNVPVIKGVTFALEPGESLAIIGPSAAGKTTLIRLLTGTLQPNTGAVRLDGADVYTWQREDFGRHVGYLPQDVELFDGTVRENISRMAEAPAEAVYEAARLAGAHETILRLPKGYETEIGDGGQHLSGGQRQQIGLARAMFGNPRMIVLDEPNSNLDGEAETALLRALDELKRRETTVVLVSHRPVLVQGVEKVLVMREGAVEMFGSRADVMKRFLKPAAPAPIPAPAQRVEGRGAQG